MTQNSADIETLAEGILSGDRNALSRGITLMESASAEHRKLASALLERLLPHRTDAIRLGITGSPGVGKSTFIESFGLYLVKAHSLKIAVLAIDPTSTKTQGSILGDKTRMAELSREKDVFIRPSPSRGSLGGVTAATMESIYLLEAAGFDVVLVETVGVGQSETAVHGMVDFFLLLMQPASGDQLQGIKRGIMEMADGIVVNKADGSLLNKAEETAKEFHLALQLMPSVREDWKTKVMHCSAIENRNMDKVWEMISNFEKSRKELGQWGKNREDQELAWFDHVLRDGLVKAFMHHKEWGKRRDAVRERIKSGEISPFRGAELLIEKIKLQFPND